MKKAVQQIMLGTVTKNEKQTAETLRRIKAAGYVQTIIESVTVT